MTTSVMQRINQLSELQESIVARERTHSATEEDQDTLRRLDHDLQVLWDLRRSELAGEEVSLDEDYYDGYTRYTDEDDPPGR